MSSRDRRCTRPIALIADELPLEPHRQRKLVRSLSGSDHPPLPFRRFLTSSDLGQRHRHRLPVYHKLCGAIHPRGQFQGAIAIAHASVRAGGQQPRKGVCRSFPVWKPMVSLVKKISRLSVRPAAFLKAHISCGREIGSRSPVREFLPERCRSDSNLWSRAATSFVSVASGPLSGEILAPAIE